MAPSVKNLFLFLIVLQFATPKAQARLTEAEVKMIKETYTHCDYVDPVGRPNNIPDIYKIPTDNCAGVSFCTKPKKGLCENRILCSGPKQPITISFYARCFSDDGISCLSAVACRDAVGLDAYEKTQLNGKDHYAVPEGATPRGTR